MVLGGANVEKGWGSWRGAVVEIGRVLARGCAEWLSQAGWEEGLGVGKMGKHCPAGLRQAHDHRALRNFLLSAQPTVQQV